MPGPAAGMIVGKATVGGLSGLRDWYNDQNIQHVNNIGDLRSWYNPASASSTTVSAITTQYYDGAKWLEIATT